MNNAVVNVPFCEVAADTLQCHISLAWCAGMLGCNVKEHLFRDSRHARGVWGPRLEAVTQI